jgi:orotidine-5'-phosphate decarboxylase
VNFADRLLKLVATKKTPLCVGLDPHEELIPDEFFRNQTKTEGIRSFLFQVITAITPFAVAVKPNAAFFEYYGAEGWKIFEEVSEEAQKNGLIVIADAKRNDIGSTAVKYAEAFFGYRKTIRRANDNTISGARWNIAICRHRNKKRKRRIHSGKNE